MFLTEKNQFKDGELVKFHHFSETSRCNGCILRVKITYRDRVDLFKNKDNICTKIKGDRCHSVDIVNFRYETIHEEVTGVLTFDEKSL